MMSANTVRDLAHAIDQCGRGAQADPANWETFVESMVEDAQTILRLLDGFKADRPWSDFTLIMDPKV